MCAEITYFTPAVIDHPASRPQAGRRARRLATAFLLAILAPVGALVISPPALAAVAPTVSCPSSCTHIAAGSAPTPRGVALDGQGNAFVTYNATGQLVKMVLSTGSVTTVASNLGAAEGVALDGQGGAYIVNSAGSLARVDLSSGVATPIATGLGSTFTVALDGQGHAYVANTSGSLIRVDLSTRSKLPIVSGLGNVRGLVLDGKGSAYVTNDAGGSLKRVALLPQAIPTTIASGLGTAYGVTLDKNGYAYVADSPNGKVWRVKVDSGAVTLAATGVEGAYGVALDGRGNIVASSTGQGQGLYEVDGLAFVGWGNGNVTFDIESGSLSISAPLAAAFPSGSPGTTISGHLGAVTVTDARALLAAEWTAAVSSSDYRTGGGTPAETITRSNVSYWSGPASAKHGTGVFTAGQESATGEQPLSGPDSLNAFRMSLGVGSNSASWDPTLDVTVPAAAVSGKYAGTVTHSVA